MNTKESTNRIVSELVKAKMDESGISQKDIAFAIRRKSQSYVSDRLNDKASWSITELDTIAPLLGYPDSLSLIASARGYAPLYDDAKPRAKTEDELVAQAFADAAMDPMALAALRSADKNKRRDRPADEGA